MLFLLNLVLCSLTDCATGETAMSGFSCGVYVYKMKKEHHNFRCGVPLVEISGIEPLTS